MSSYDHTLWFQYVRDPTVSWRNPGRVLKKFCSSSDARITKLNNSSWNGWEFKDMKVLGCTLSVSYNILKMPLLHSFYWPINVWIEGLLLDGWSTLSWPLEIKLKKLLHSLKEKKLDFKIKAISKLSFAAETCPVLFTLALDSLQAERFKKFPLTQEYCALLSLEVLYLWNSLPTCSQEARAKMLQGKTIMWNYVGKSPCIIGYLLWYHYIILVFIMHTVRKKRKLTARNLRKVQNIFSPVGWVYSFWHHFSLVGVPISSSGYKNSDINTFWQKELFHYNWEKYIFPSRAVKFLFLTTVVTSMSGWSAL